MSDGDKNPDPEDGFLGRWSRRKRAADRPEASLAAPEVDPDLVEDPGAEAELDCAPLTEAEIAALPRIEDLVEGSDIKAFLRAGVPRALKNAALRRVWMLTPAIRDYKNPAVDYAWDWNTPGGVPGDGAAPSAERSAQMLRDLLAPRPQPVLADPETIPPEGVAEGMPAAETETTEATRMRGANAPASTDNADCDPESDPLAGIGQGVDGMMETEQAQAPAPARPRHGGAMPM